MAHDHSASSALPAPAVAPVDGPCLQGLGDLERSRDRLAARLQELRARGTRRDKNERGETFYRVTVRTEKNHLGTEEHPLPIIPGMVATVEILTGHKTVLDYLLKPARTLRDDAFHEH